MAHFERDDIPFHFALADAFTVCDAYHCSLMTSTDPNRYYLWTGFTGNDGKGGGPVLDNAEAGYDWTTYPERLQAAGVSWKIYQDIGTGLDAERLLGLDRRRLHRQLRRHLGAVLPPVPERQGRRPAVRQRAHRHQRRGRPELLRRAGPGREERHAAAGLLDHRAGGLQRAPELAGELRRLVPLAGPGHPVLRPGPVEQDRAVHHLRRERRLLRPRGPAVRARRPGRRRLHGGHLDRVLLRRRAASTRAPTAWACGCRCSWSRPGAGAAGWTPRPSTTPR